LKKKLKKMKFCLLALSLILVLVQCLNAAPYGDRYKSAKRSYGGDAGYGGSSYKSASTQDKYDKDDEYNSYGGKSYGKYGGEESYGDDSYGEKESYGGKSYGEARKFGPERESYGKTYGDDSYGEKGYGYGRRSYGRRDKYGSNYDNDNYNSYGSSGYGQKKEVYEGRNSELGYVIPITISIKDERKSYGGSYGYKADNYDNDDSYGQEYDSNNYGNGYSAPKHGYGMSYGNSYGRRSYY
jgi:hypothetical protein